MMLLVTSLTISLINKIRLSKTQMHEKEITCTKVVESGMKNVPVHKAASIKNLKNQNLQKNNIPQQITRQTNKESSDK